MSEEKDIKKEPGKISRREFLKDAGIVVGGTAVSSAFFLSACGKEVEVTKTVTTTAPGTTSTITKTAPGTTSTVTTTAAGSTQTITKYTCPVCSQEFSSLDALKNHFDEEHSGVIKNVISVNVNGREHQFEVDPSGTLRDLLRDKLGLTSIKDMCAGYGACGSCTVVMNGRPVLSCMTLASECDGANIQTAEGISETNQSLVQNYVKNHCMQCGYCTPGFIVTAKALLDHNPNPSREEILEALSGNLCYCATYPQHVLAIQETAKS